MIQRAADIKDTDSTGTPEREAAAESTAETRDSRAHPASLKMRRRIGSTAYEVEVRFSDKSGETMNDKILRLVRGGAVKSDMEGRK